MADSENMPSISDSSEEPRLVETQILKATTLGEFYPEMRPGGHSYDLRKKSSSNISHSTDRPVKRGTSIISYETLIWTVFSVTTALCVVDRFVLSGDVVCGRSGKATSRLWGSRFGETLTNLLWGVTARLIIPAQNMMFYTSLWCLPNVLCDLCPKWVSIGSMRHTHIRMHRWIGLYLIAIPSLAHVLVIFVPPLLDGTDLTYHPPSEFNYSSQLWSMNWTKFWDPAAVNNWSFNDSGGVHLTSDEIYRFVLMILIFCFFFPLSQSQFLNQRSYTLAISLHVFAGVWYSVDNIRKITHGLAHVVNLPVMIVWAIDRLLAVTTYRKIHGTVGKKVSSENYVVMLVKLSERVRSGVGDTYYLLQRNLKGIPLQRSHPFTSFSNHGGTLRDQDWDVGFVVTVMPEKANVWSQPWTKWLYDVETEPRVPLTFWGPYRSSGEQLLRYLTREELTKAKFVLLASGSGFGYILDVLNFIQSQNLNDDDDDDDGVIDLQIAYTTRSPDVHDFFARQTSQLANAVRAKRSRVRIQISAFLSGASGTTTRPQYPNVDSRFGQRLDFNKILSSAPKKSRVFFVGNPALGDKLGRICRESGLKFYEDFSGTTTSTGGDQEVFCRFFRWGIRVVVVVVVVCVGLHLVFFMRRMREAVEVGVVVGGNQSRGWY